MTGPIESWLGFDAQEAASRVLDRVKHYVEHETPSGAADAISELSRRIEAELVALAAHVESTDAPGRGRNLYAKFAGRDASLARILILTHIDTVHPVGTLRTQPFRVQDGRAGGPGIYDMKCGLALFVEALSLLRARGSAPRRSVDLLITCDEEIGSHSALPLFRAAGQGAFAALVPEPCLPDGSVKTARKGVSTYTIETTGRAGHAGLDTHTAASAITELAHHIPAILALAESARGTIVNIGVIRGGTASNVVAAHALAEVDVRVVDAPEAARVERTLRAFRPHLPGADIRIARAEHRPPLVRTDDIVRLYASARDVAAGLGVELGEGSSGGGSDGSLVAALGVPTLDGLGPRGGGAHAADEHVLVADLPFRLAFYARVLETL